MRILLTGSTGFIGSCLLEELLLIKKIKILAVSRKKNKSKGNITYIKTDLKNIHLYKDEIISFSPNIIIHLAWEGIPVYTKKYCKINYINSINLAKICLDIDGCSKFISFGSCLEYKKRKGKCFENNYLNRKSIFSKTKIQIYEDLKKFFIKKRINLIWFRLFYVYGRGQRKGSLIPSIIGKLNKNKNFYFKNPFFSNDYINVKDVTRLIIKSLNQKEISGIYNVGSGQTHQNYEIYKTISHVINPKNLMLPPNKKKQSNNFYASLKKTNLTFKWKPRISILKGIIQMINEK